MAQTITLPREGIPIAGALLPSREWRRWAFDITTRVGGVEGVGNAELLQAIEDNETLIAEAGDVQGQVPLPEQIQAVSDENDRLRAEVAELREIVFELYKSVQGISQGVVQ